MFDVYRTLYSCQTDDGFIVWRLGTGENFEILHLKAFVPRMGVGRSLLKKALARMKRKPPYATVFGFTRSSNTAAIEFYKAMGFDLTEVKGVYADGTAVLFSQEYKKLLEVHGL